jgi:hypothetical protein
MFQDYSRTTLIAAASAAWLACGSGVASQGVGSAAPALPDASVTNNAAANAQTYNALAATLDAKRSEFLPKSAAEHTAVGNRLFWLEFETFIPKLRSVELRTKATVSYDFSIGVEQSAYVYKASSELIVTVARTSTGLVYRAFDPLATNAKVSEFSTQAPASGERWWAFSVDARTVYLAKSMNGGELYAWQPGEPAPRLLLNLADAGVKLGILEEFSVEGEQMVLLESGRLWSLNLRTKAARRLANKKQADHVTVNSDGILYRTPDGLFFEDSLQLTRNLTSEIAGATSPIFSGNEGHYDIGLPATMSQGTVVFIGYSGVFAFSLRDKKVRPILLESKDFSRAPRIDYRAPQIAADGSLFVLGLISQSGAVGAEGPIFRVSNW